MSPTALPPFKVGQVIYLIPDGERRVVPAQVTEEILRRTITGTETVWMIQLIGSSKSVPLDPDAAEYFTSVDALREALTERTLRQLNAMIDKTVKAAAEAFERSQEDSEVEDESPELPQQDITVTLPDGTKAKVKM